MTSSVIKVLEKISTLALFNDKLYFTGGTALAYYINHRVSEDIDIISPQILDYKKIIPSMLSVGAKKIEDENILALRLVGLFPDEYIIKFILDGVKIEFFYANRPIQKEILHILTFSHYENTNLKILSLELISKLKLVAFFQRDKMRDLFDFGAILDDQVVTFDEILIIAQKTKNINSKQELLKFISNKKEAKDDESVYLDENNRLDLSFENIRNQVISKLQ